MLKFYVADWWARANSPKIAITLKQQNVSRAVSATDDDDDDDDEPLCAVMIFYLFEVKRYFTAVSSAVCSLSKTLSKQHTMLRGYEAQRRHAKTVVNLP